MTDQKVEDNQVDNIEVEAEHLTQQNESKVNEIPVEKLYEKIEELQKKLDLSENSDKKAQDQYIRAHAEMENIRRRSERDVSNARKFALERFSKDLLPVIDSMEKALEVQSESEDMGAMKEGISMTMKIFLDTISKFGLQQIATIGEAFDPNIHEAMAMQPSNEVAENYIIEVFQNGYELNGRVIRPARVIVSKG